MPAGTGVCVVKTLLARAASSASSNVSLCSRISSRIRSMREKRRVAFVHVVDGGLERPAS